MKQNVFFQWLKIPVSMHSGYFENKFWSPVSRGQKKRVNGIRGEHGPSLHHVDWVTESFKHHQQISNLSHNDSLKRNPCYLYLYFIFPLFPVQDAISVVPLYFGLCDKTWKISNTFLMIRFWIIMLS